MKEKFGVFFSKLSEVFWDISRSFVEFNEHMLSLRGAFFRTKAPVYAGAVKESGAPLLRCICFIDFTKIQMASPGGYGSLQRACYSGHKRMHCLIY